jgi:hypothetical protein
MDQVQIQPHANLMGEGRFWWKLLPMYESQDTIPDEMSRVFFFVILL